MDCSIIICTRDRAEMLEKTLRAFCRVTVPDDMQVEMIIVDNGSSDRTADVVAGTSIPGMELRHLSQPSPGKSRAQNTALASARGTALLFTDDDVEPAENWLECMARPLLEHECDAVASVIQLAGELRRPWMEALHLLWLADVPSPASSAFGLVGASMGIHRSVFERIGVFDENLGPGASGFGEETLLWMQMREAGMKILPVTGTRVIHRPDAGRLRRASWLATAKRFGQTRAYVMHHWEHVGIAHPRARRLWNLMKLFLRKPFRLLVPDDAEGCPSWELSYLVRIYCCEAYLSESKRPRIYPERGLRARPRVAGHLDIDSTTPISLSHD